MEFNLLLHGKKLEVRPAHFLKAFNRELENMAIISFGACNLSCPYCKRDGQFKDEQNNIIKSQSVSWDTLKALIDSAVTKGQRIRLSGGDPCMYLEESLFIAKYVMDTYGQKISVAHNGTSVYFIQKMLPYLDYVAIDYKGGTKESFAKRSDINETFAKKFIQSTIAVQTLCADNNILVDVRTCVFADTNIAELKTIASNISTISAVYKNIFWTLRKYSPVAGCSFESMELEDMQQMAIELKKEYPDLPIGIRNKWQKSGFDIF